MASMIALLEEHDELVPGSVLPIDRYLTDDSALAPLGHGGTLYVVAIGENEKLFLVAALEQPERSRVFRGDMRPDGWYAPANTAPVTDIGKLRKVLGVGTKAQQAKKLREPRKITKEAEAKLRAAFDESDAPVIEAAVVRSASIEARIAELLALWQTTPAVEIADAIDRATRLLPRSDEPLLDSHDEDAGHEAREGAAGPANRAADRAARALGLDEYGGLGRNARREDARSHRVGGHRRRVPRARGHVVDGAARRVRVHGEPARHRDADRRRACARGRRRCGARRARGSHRARARRRDRRASRRRRAVPRLCRLATGPRPSARRVHRARLPETPQGPVTCARTPARRARELAVPRRADR